MQDNNDEEPSQEQHQQHQPPTGPSQQARHAGRSRLTHTRLWAFAVLVMLAVVAVILTTASSNGTPRVHHPSAQAITPARQVDALLAGIPQAGNALGSPTAPATLQFYGDLECPTSSAFTLFDLPSLISKWVRGGQLRIEYRSLQTATRQPAVFMAQQAAALAAGAQDKGWYYIELFYHEQGHEGSGYVTDTYLDDLARQIPGLNLALWSKDRAEPPLAARVASDEQTAARLGLHSTPALLLERTGSGDARPVPPFQLGEPTALHAAIEDVLARASRSHASLALASASAGRRAFADRTAGAGTQDTQGAPC
jgi:protein-disulfide isomerase